MVKKKVAIFLFNKMNLFMQIFFFLFIIPQTFFFSCKQTDLPKDTTTEIDTTTYNLNIISITVEDEQLYVASRVTNVNRNFPAIIQFNYPLDTASINFLSLRIAKAGANADFSFSFTDSNKTILVNASTPLDHFDFYQLILSNTIKSEEGYLFSGYTKNFYTEIDSTPKFPVISDDALLNEIQQQTFKYFWDFAHPVSGLSRERESSGDIVTIGGSGFGVMAIVVGIDRGFISRLDGVTRLNTIVDFLTNTADRYHGAWPHWINGATGNVVPFSPYDDGADLVETSYMIHGLLTVRQYLNAADDYENDLITKINNICNTVEWDWFTKGGEDVLYWHWSPDFGWYMNFPINGYNEALITYFLAGGSTTFGIDASVYHNGWTNSDHFINGNYYYDYFLPLGFSYGGPLFFAHYSFLGLDPRNLSDAYANYWTQNVNHTLINYTYCTINPQNYVGYSSDCWGLTASDNQNGYNAHSPTNDLGVISPTAAISSLPYTPDESMQAIKFFYYTIGDKIWGDYGFYDAFNVTDGWFGTSYLAIDQGPEIIMIENYRSNLLWNLFMSCPEVATAATNLGFTY